MVISGRNFSSAGRIEVDRAVISSQAIRSWTGDLIVFQVPESMRSGMLRIRTDTGSSNEVFIVNAREIPVTAEAGLPEVRNVTSINLFPGALVTIQGDNFGTRHGGAFLEFRSDTPQETLRIPAESFWIREWSARTIRITIPPGIPAGQVTVLLNGVPLAVGFTSLPPEGTKEDHDPRSWEVVREVRVPESWRDARPEELQLPILPEQPHVAAIRHGLVAPEHNESVEEVAPEVTVYHVDRVDRRAVRWTIGTVAPTATLLEEEFAAAFRLYLGSDGGVSVRNPRVDQLRRSQVNLRNTIPDIARRIHVVVQDTLEPDPEGTVDLGEALDGAGARAEVFADLAVALLRISGLPARRHFGYLITDDGGVVAHAWAEVFFPRLGWVPMDPALGAGMHQERTAALEDFYGENRRTSTFAALDDRRLTVTLDDPDLRESRSRRRSGSPLEQLAVPPGQTMPDPAAVHWKPVGIVGIH